MGNDIRVKISSSTNSAGFKEVNRDMAETAVAAESTGRSFKDLDDKIKSADRVAGVAGYTMDKFGHNMTEADRAAGKLDHSTASVKHQVEQLNASIAMGTFELKRMASALAETDNAAHRLDLKKSMSSLKSDINASKVAKGLLSDVVPDFASTIGKSATAAQPQVVAALVGAGVIASPMIGAAIAGALTLAAGGAGLAGGLMLAARSTQVKAAGKELGNNLLTDLTRRSVVFIDPVLHGIDSIKNKYGGMSSNIDALFKNSARFVAPTLNGLLTFLDKVVGGFAKLSKVGDQTFQEFSVGLGHTGDALGDLFSSLADNGVDAAMGMKLTFDVLNGTIRVVGATVNGLTEAFGFLAKFGFGLPIIGSEIAKQYNEMQEKSKEGTEANVVLSRSVNDVKDGYEALPAPLETSTAVIKANERVVRNEVGALEELANALKAQSDPTFDFIEKQKKMKEAQTEVNTAMKKHGQNSPEYRDALIKEGRAATDVSIAASKVADLVDGRMTPSLRAMLIASGMSAGSVDNLAREFVKAKHAGDAFARNYKASVALLGIKPTADALAAYHRALDGIPRSITTIVQVQTRYPSTRDNADRLKGYAHGGIKGAASGMATDGWTWTGEAGPELVKLPPGSQVRSTGDSMRSARQAMSTSGHAEYPPIIIRGDGTRAMAFLVEMMRNAVLTQGGGSVARLLNSPGMV